MKNIFSFLLFVILSFLPCSSAWCADRLVGADISLVPAYEAAGDQWLNESGVVIPDMLAYLKDAGWNSIRVRLFVDPSQDSSDPAVCQDFDYALALGKRVKEAGMNFLLDFHYSDTWCDPGQQKIPAAWTDHSDAALASQLYTYTHTVIKGLIDGGATPDYVQIGNEITYGLLWNTADGKFPTSSSQYASVGYCPTWSSRYSDGEAQWMRTASFLNNAAHGVRQAFTDAALDSTKVKIVVHNEMSGNQYNSDNFYKHIRTAGFDNYDVIGLSYYPFWNGKLDVLGGLITTLKRDFSEKKVQIVETAWYNGYYPYTVNAKNEYTIASLNENWTADAQGMVNYLADLTTYLKRFDNVDGIYYWTPEECGSGYEKTVWNHNFNRGMWKSSSQQKHNILMAADGTTPVQALARYLADDGGQETEDASDYFVNLGFETGDLSGWTLEQTWATQKASDLTSWASSEVIRGTYSLELWNPTQTEGPIISQLATLPDGRYTVTVKARANKRGFYLIANGAKTAITAETAGTWAATTNVKYGVLEIGLGCKESSDDNYMYADDFVVTRIGDATDDPDIDNTTEDNPVVDEYTDEQGILYSLDNENLTATVKSGKAVAWPEVTIPSQITVDETSYYVNAIGANAFTDNSQLYSIFIGKSVNAIWNSAFNGCWNLTKLKFEEDSELRTIDGWTFLGCNIDSLDIPAGVTKIPEGAFSNCWNLNYVALRGEVTQIDAFAFSKWSSADTIYAERSYCPLKGGVWIYSTEVPQISPKAFSPADVAEDTLYVHYALVDNEVYNSLGFNAVLPLDESDGSVTYIDEQGVKYAVWDATGLADVVGYSSAYAPDAVSDWQITIPEVVTVDEVEYEVSTIAPHAFDGHWRLSAVTLPETIVSIGEWAFCNTAISKIVVGEGVETIAEGTFSKCWNLTSAEFQGNISSIGDFAFSGWAEEGCVPTGNTFSSLTLWSNSVPEISPRAFHPSDIAQGSLYVDKSLVNNSTYTSLGFAHVYPIDPDGIHDIYEMTNDSMANAKWPNGKFYDLTGRPVRNPRRGVYIVSGRKIVW